MKVIYINTGFEDYVSSENIYILLWYFVINDNEAPSTISQIVEQIEVITDVYQQFLSSMTKQ